MIDSIPAVIGVLGALAAALWWLRKKGIARFPHPRGTPRRLESIERLALAPQHALHLVRLDDRIILVAQSPSGVSLLASDSGAARAAAAGERT